jgi:predicted polyphosphate/ATP-dependent NAD kinase
MKGRWGLVINPWAGIGGPVGLKGSDGDKVRQEALARGAVPGAAAKVRRALQMLDNPADIHWFTGSGPMGADVLDALGAPVEVIHHVEAESSADDTRKLVQACLERQADMLVIAGGDGTLRDVADVYPVDGPPVVGIPAGTKIHSGAYAISPEAAGLLLGKIARGEAVERRMADVMDIDEEAFRRGSVRARRHGELPILTDGVLVQQVKSAAAAESEALQLQALAEGAIDRWQDDTLYIVGSGSTLRHIMEIKGLPSTLLGIDVVFNDKVLVADARESDLLSCMASMAGHPVKIWLTAIGGQGHILGRGNQPVSPRVLRLAGRYAIEIFATKSKMASLAGRPLLLDSGDPETDRLLSGPLPVWVDYNECWHYPAVGNPQELLRDS